MEESAPTNPTPTTNPSTDASAPSEKKTVAFSAQSIASANTAVHSPVAEKIMLRKPTPFNNDLAASIRKSGFGPVIPNTHQQNDSATNGDHTDQTGPTDESAHNEDTPPSEIVNATQEDPVRSD